MDRGELRADRIKNWPSGERPRERLLNRGAEQLTDAELLAIVLRVGVGPSKADPEGRSAVAIARSLLADFGGLSGLDRAEKKDLLSIVGLSSAKVSAIKAAFELGKRLRSNVALLSSFETSSEVAAYVGPRLSTARNEIVLSLFLDGQNHFLGEKVITDGTPVEAAIFTRKILEEALRTSAVALVLVHNHPSGNPQPSLHDDKTTADLDRAASLLGLVMIDHVIIGGEDYFSYSDSGRLEMLQTQRENG